MSFNRNKLTFKVDESTGEIIQPQVILCDRQLNKIGEIFPIRNLRVKCLLNGADEVSFSTSKEAAMYDRIRDYSVVFVRGFGYFEVSPSVNSSFDETKEVQGASLGEAELSQLLCTLECNTENDLENSGKGPTILCDKKNEETSLIHRILSNYAPIYEVGHVDDTIGSIQRTFSFSNLDIMSCFSEIAEELNCIFDVSVRKNENGTVVRQVNIYDAQFCQDCRSRTIINGRCHACGSTNIGGIGEDTTIKIGTDNLSDEITLSSDGKMKNCFIVEGGDELMTNTINGITPSGTNKLYMFSEETINSFSPALRKKYATYMTEYGSQKSVSEKIYETECNIIDLILYLQSGRMPTPETDHRDLHEETAHIIQTYNKYFPRGLGMLDSADTSSRNSIIRQLFSVFADKGYAVRQEGGTYNADSKKWTGSIIVYETGNNDSNAVISVSEQSSTITYSDSNENEQAPLQIQFTENHETYLEQTIALRTKSYENLNHLTGNSPKDWQKYSLNRLNSFCDGYRACKDVLEEQKKNSELKGIIDGADKLLEKYNSYIAEISEYTVRLENIIYYLYSYYGKTDSVPSEIIFKTRDEAFQNMIQYIQYGTWTGGTETENTDAALYCSKCGSTNVTINGCNNCAGKAVTYSDLAKAVYSHNQNKTANLLTQRRQINDSLNLKTYLCDESGDDSLYRELCSYIREDVYTNSNFISDGLEKNNTKLISQAKELLEKAEQELARACVPQHTLTGNVYAFTAYSSLNKNDFPIRDAYSKFILGNFMRFISGDGTVYKLRLSSEEFSWGDSDVSLNVEFTDVVRSADGTISDIETLIQHVGNLATSFDSVKKQAEQGETASKTFEAIKNEGLYSALGNVLNAKNQDVQVTENGITLREYDHELDDYDEHQMKLVNRNIVMTENGWKSAKLAIGLGQYNGTPMYGVWADVLVGNLLVGNELKIENKNNSVVIDEEGITLDGGSIQWKNPISQDAVEGLPATLDTFVQDTVYKEDIEKLQNQIDGSITTWFQNGVPTLSNYPTNEWTSEQDKNVHLGDLYYDNNTGYAYRFQYSDSVYSWKKIEDSDVTKALADAKNAQDTADGKRRVFVTTPTPPYDKGDLWTQGSDGDLYRCNIPKEKNESFESRDWILATKYTDDTKAIAVETALNNYKNEIKNFQNQVITALTGSSTTDIGKDYVISPKIGGGYLYIANNDYSVEIDPNHRGGNKTSDGYLFCIKKKDKDSTVMGVNTNGTGYFSGNITCNAGNIGGWHINSSKIYTTTVGGDGIGNSLHLDSEKCEIFTSNDFKDSNGIKTREDTFVKSGSVRCRTYKSTEQFATSVETSGNGIKFYSSTLGNSEYSKNILFDLSKHALELNIPLIRRNGEPLSEWYCVVRSGKHELPGDGKTHTWRVDFDDVTYEQIPFVNILPFGTVLVANISITRFIGNDSSGYTGFEYSAYYPNTSYNYTTRWFAVGNKKS